MAKSLLDLVRSIDSVPDNYDFSNHYQLLLPNDPRPHGLIHPSILPLLPLSPAFHTTHSPTRTVTLTCPPGPPCTLAFQETIDALIASRAFPTAASHSELYRVIGAAPPVLFERFPYPLFGLAGRGAHMTAFVRDSDGGTKLWIPRRARHLFTFPGMLDTCVGGGVKADQTPRACVVAEAGEEASLDAAFVEEHARSAGVITRLVQSRIRDVEVVSSSVLYVFDVELPEVMVPSPGDEEVEAFHLWGVEEVKERLLRGEFGPSSALATIDFLIRHGFVRAEEEEGYAEIGMRLRRRLPVALGPL